MAVAISHREHTITATTDIQAIQLYEFTDIIYQLGSAVLTAKNEYKQRGAVDHELNMEC